MGARVRPSSTFLCTLANCSHGNRRGSFSFCLSLIFLFLLSTAQLLHRPLVELPLFADFKTPLSTQVAAALLEDHLQEHPWPRESPLSPWVHHARYSAT